jgi:hypothetical protein
MVSMAADRASGHTISSEPNVGANQALAAMRTMMSKLKLTVNENKTRVCCLPEEKFDFLGYSVLQKHTDKEFIMN